MSNNVSIRRADIANDEDAAIYLALLDAYSSDPMGDAKPLDQEVRERIIPALRDHPTTLIWLAFDGDQPVGFVTAFLGFSTFRAMPLVNLHDVAVLPAARGLGVGRKLLSAVEAFALEKGCCRLTLEVLEGNAPAKGLYESYGFGPVTYGEGTGAALFYAKPIGES